MLKFVGITQNGAISTFCSECNREFGKRRNYVNHFNTVHKAEVVIDGITWARDPVTKMFTCIPCNKTFRSVRNIELTHSKCVIPAAAISPGLTLESFAASNDLFLSAEGNCLVCVKHATIIGNNFLFIFSY